VNLSIRQVSIQTGMNTAHIAELTRVGALTVQQGSSPRRSKYSKGQVDGLAVGLHYVVCRACGSWAGQITTKHLTSCSGMTVESYRSRWPDAPMLCEVVRGNKAKSDNQRRHQSEVLRSRFQTELGDATRREISAASVRMHVTPSGRRSVDALTALNRTPARRASVSRTTKFRWVSGPMREQVILWHRVHRARSLGGAAHARSFVVDKSMTAARAAMPRTSMLHLRFKDRMVAAGITGFVTEGRVGHFDVDEAHFGMRIAVEIDGCYWHGCAECGHTGVPRVVSNDNAKAAYLRAAGWTLIRIPGHTVRGNPKQALQLVRDATAGEHP
jgi:very-short-patch-repair endonuclease